MVDHHSNPFMDDKDSHLENQEQRWSPEAMLRQSGIFYLEEVVKTLDIDSGKLKGLVQDWIAADKDIWRLMGIRKMWGQWIVRMSVFAPFYQRILAPRARPIPLHWDAETLLRQNGWFFLNEVCARLSYSLHKLQVHIRKLDYPRETIGLWKDPERMSPIVDMSLFGPWMTGLLQGERERLPKSTQSGRSSQGEVEDSGDSTLR